MSGISVKLPLTISEDDGYSLNKTFRETIKQNLKNLLLTNPGERIMYPNFGVGLSTFLFEMNNGNTYSLISVKIHEQIKKYMSFLEIDNIEFLGEDNYLSISIRYTITPLGSSDTIDLSISNNF